MHDVINDGMIEARQQDIRFVIDGAISEPSELAGKSARDIQRSEVVSVDMFRS
jgi:hypothetical protein